MHRERVATGALVAWLLSIGLAVAQPAKPAAPAAKPAPADPRVEALKKEAMANVDGRAKLAQEMVDSVFSFGELGFQELETRRSHTRTCSPA